jgi:hypothetical protein
LLSVFIYKELFLSDNNLIVKNRQGKKAPGPGVAGREILPLIHFYPAVAKRLSCQTERTIMILEVTTN